MPTAEKAETIEQAKAWYGKSVGVVFSDYRGLSVRDIQGLRASVRKKGGELHVLKNTLFRLAIGDHLANLPDEFHNGTTAFTFVYQNETDVSKTLVDFARTSRKLVVKGGYFGGKALSGKEVEALAALPPRDILIAQVIGAIAAPLTTLVGTIEALYADPIRVIGAVADKFGADSPAPATHEPAATVDEPVAEAAAEATVIEAPVAESAPAPAAEMATEEGSATEVGAEMPVAAEPVSEEPSPEAETPGEDSAAADTAPETNSQGEEPNS